MYSSKLCRDRYSMNAMVLLPYPSYFSSGFQLFYPPRVIPIGHFRLPCSCPHIPIGHSRTPAFPVMFPVISHVRVIPTLLSTNTTVSNHTTEKCGEVTDTSYDGTDVW